MCKKERVNKQSEQIKASKETCFGGGGGKGRGQGGGGKDNF